MINFVKPVITINGDGSEDKTFKFYEEGFELNGSIGESWQDVTIAGKMSLTLLNAKANGLNYLKAFGGTEQRNLPKEYTQVEYLENENNGGQYIDTGVLITSDLKLEIDFKLTSSGGSKYIMGRYSGNNGAFYMYQASTVFQTAYGCQYANTTQAINTDRHYWKFYIENNTTMVECDNNVVLTKDTVSNIEQVPIYIAGSSQTSVLPSRTYGAKMYQNDVLVRNFIPAKRNSDNVLGMYDTVTDTFLTNAGTGTFTAGANATPTPDTPIDIVCNNGVLKVSPNLFDKNATWINFNDAAEYVAIPVPNGTYTCSTNLPGAPSSNAWFDNQNLIFSTSVNRVYENQPRTVTVTEGMLYFAIRTNSIPSFKTLLLDGTYWVQIEQGSTATTYMPYKQVYVDGIQETININYFDKNTMIVEGKFVRAGNTTTSKPLGSETGMATWNCSTYIKVEPNTEYTTIVPYYASASGAGLVFFSSNTVKSAISGITTSTQASATYTFTTPNNCNYIRFSWQTDQGNDVYLIKTGNTATCENLLSVSTYKDVQSILDGAITRNVGIKVLDGSEDWEISGTANFYFAWEGMEQDKDITPLCTHFVGISTSTSFSGIDYPAIRCGYQNTASAARNRIYIKDASFTSLNDLKSFLATQYTNGTPVIVVYPLATATTSSVTAQTLTIQGGTNIIEVTQSSIDDLELEAQYKAGVGVTITEIQNVNLDNSVTVTIS